MKKKIFILVVFLFSLFALVGCGQPVEGPQGPAGAKGANGKSAYEIAVENGFNGTEEAWLASLHGEDGENGLNGKDGQDGAAGEPGTPAREMEVFIEDGGLYWRYVGEEDAKLLFYYLDYVTVSYAYRPDFTYASLVAELKAAGAPDSEWSHADAHNFFNAHPEYEWLLRYFAETHPEMADFVAQYIANGRTLDDCGQYVVRQYASGPEATTDDKADYALSTELAGFLAGDDGEGGVAVWEGVWKCANYDATTEKGKANLDLLAKYAYVEVYSEQVKRNAVKAFTPMSIEANEADSEELAAAKAAIAAWLGEEYGWEYWTDEDGEKVEQGVPNHSTMLFGKKYKKIKVTLKPGDGLFVADAVAAVFTDFLADFNASEYKLEEAVTTLHDLCASGNKGNVFDFLAADGQAETPKWNWLTSYLSSLNSYKAELKALAEKTAVPGTRPDSGYQTVYTVFNFFGNESWKAHYENGELNSREIPFWTNNYAGILEYLPEKYLVKEAKENVIVALGLPVVIPGEKLVGWYLEGDETETIVAPADMVMDGVYLPKFLSDEQIAEAKALMDAFLADVSTALGKNYTGQGLFNDFRDSSADDATKVFMGVIEEDGVLVKFGQMVGHEDVIAKHAFIFEYIANLLVQDEWKGSSNHKYEHTVMSLFGITVPENARVVTEGANKYYNRCMVVQLVNLINHTNTDTKEEGYPSIDFSRADLWCLGLLEYKAAYDAAHPAA